jgi:predicted dehydrogenase
MRRTITIGLIGAGGIGKVWADALIGAKGIRLHAVVDTDRSRAEEVASRIKGAHAYTRIEEALSDKTLDAVVIATPHKYLAPLSYKALLAGKHVLCEKPSGISSKEVAKNIALAKKKRLLYMPAFNHRYHPAYMKAMEIFQKGGIGNAAFIRARYGFGGRKGYEKEWRFKKRISGGGELLDQGMHMIDMARWFLGDFTKVQGHAENYFWGGDVEDNGFLLMRTKKGQIASLHVSWTNWEWVHSFELFGDKGYLQIEGLDQRYKGPERLIWGKRDATFSKPKETTYMYKDEKKHDSFRREAEAFANAIGNPKARVGIPQGEDARMALHAVEQVYGATK